MSYLLDRQTKVRHISYGVFAVIFFVIVFYFKSPVWSGVSSLGNTVARPFLVVGNKVGGKFLNIRNYFSFKNSLIKENENLKIDLENQKMQVLNYNTILSENLDLKNILGRKVDKRTSILGVILSKPDQSLYDILTIDVGSKNGVKIGDMVFANGNIPVGRVSDVYDSTSKVILFSTSGEKTQVIVSGKNVYMELVGRGGGNFEMILPRDFVLLKDDQVVLAGINSHVVGIVETILSDPRDPFIKALLVSPVNIQETKFVEVEI